MNGNTDQLFFLKETFPGAGPELVRLLHGAAENAYLLRSDFYTMRDWLEMADAADPDVLVAVLLLMLVALEEGSLCIELARPPLLGRLRDFVPEAEAAAWAERIERVFTAPAQQENAFPRLIGATPRDHKPVILHAVHGRRFLYFQKYLRAEIDFQQALDKRLQSPPASPPIPWPALVHEVLVEQPLRLGNRPMELDREQRLALDAALGNNVTIISGGPGTGKTSIVLTILRCLVRGGCLPERIALAAPTGRAAQRLTDALRTGLTRLESVKDGSADATLRGLEANTLHHLLGYRPSRNLFTRHAENPIPADVVIVDEVSMVGLVLMAQLLHALSPATKLILLGDRDQLPSVEAGAVLAHLVADEPQGPGPHCILLQTNHRSQQDIRAAAQAINAQDASVVERLPPLAKSQQDLASSWQSIESGGFWLLEQVAASASELRGFLQHWADLAYFHSRHEGASLAELVNSTGPPLDDAAASAHWRRVFRALDRFRLLTLVREGPWGCVDINRFLDQYLRPRLAPDARGELFAGAPVLITRNDAVRGLHNGDVGIALPGRGGIRVVFERHDGFVSFPAEALPAHELGFALTVHKSQGSEYANVLLVLPPTGAKRLLTKELIYTGITRARSAAVICSTKEVLKAAIARRIVRESRLI